MRISRFSHTITKHILQLDLVPRAVAAGRDGAHVVAIEERLAGVDAADVIAET